MKEKKISYTLLYVRFNLKLFTYYYEDKNIILLVFVFTKINYYLEQNNVLLYVSKKIIVTTRLRESPGS